MPLSKGCTARSIRKNIAELRRSGRSQAQAVAIAGKLARKHCVCLSLTACQKKTRGRR